MTTQATDDKSIRAWWTRKTQKVGRMILISSLVALVGALFFFRYAPPELVVRIQSFNGAMTIPVAGAIWVAAFVFQFLIPSREVAFRSQETLERTEERVKASFEKLDRFLEQQAIPTVETFQRIMKAFETKYFADIQSTIYVCQYAAKNAVDTATRTEKIALDLHRDGLPAIAAASRILATLEKHLDGGLLDRLNVAAETASTLGPVKGGATAPDLARGLELIRKSKLRKTPAAAPSPVQAEPALPAPAAPAASLHEALTVKAESAPPDLSPQYPRIRAMPVNGNILVAERSRA